MGKIIEFAPRQSATTPRTVRLQQDAYLEFLRHVVSTANACGFSFSCTNASSAEHLYEHTRHRSRLAKLLDHKGQALKSSR